MKLYILEMIWWCLYCFVFKILVIVLTQVLQITKHFHMMFFRCLFGWYIIVFWEIFRCMIGYDSNLGYLVLLFFNLVSFYGDDGITLLLFLFCLMKNVFFNFCFFFCFCCLLFWWFWFNYFDLNFCEWGDWQE